MSGFCGDDAYPQVRRLSECWLYAGWWRAVLMYLMQFFERLPYARKGSARSECQNSGYLLPVSSSTTQSVLHHLGIHPMESLVAARFTDAL